LVPTGKYARVVAVNSRGGGRQVRGAADAADLDRQRGRGRRAVRHTAGDYGLSCACSSTGARLVTPACSATCGGQGDAD
jgi:hypothetical protein